MPSKSMSGYANVACRLAGGPRPFQAYYRKGKLQISMGNFAHAQAAALAVAKYRNDPQGHLAMTAKVRSLVTTTQTREAKVKKAEKKTPKDKTIKKKMKPKKEMSDDEEEMSDDDDDDVRRSPLPLPPPARPQSTSKPSAPSPKPPALSPKPQHQPSAPIVRRSNPDRHLPRRRLRSRWSVPCRGARPRPRQRRRRSSTPSRMARMHRGATRKR